MIQQPLPMAYAGQKVPRREIDPRPPRLMILRVLELCLDICIIGLTGVYCERELHCPVDFITHFDVEGNIFSLFVACIAILLTGFLLCTHIAGKWAPAKFGIERPGYMILIPCWIGVAVTSIFYAAHYRRDLGRDFQATYAPQWVAAAVLAFLQSGLHIFDLISSHPRNY